jgi:hypothetical protein
MDETSDTDESLRSHRNEFQGYAAGPMERTGKMRLRLDFNPHLVSETDGKTTLTGFSLRIMEHPEDVRHPIRRAEFGVSLTVEQWQDLISAMQAELDLARESRAFLEDND